MKKSKIIIICLMLLSLVIVGVSFAFLDDTIPIHFGIDGKPDQYGSKYFLLMVPSVSILIGVIMLLVARYGKVSENYKKYLLLTSVVVEIIFLVCNSIMVAYAVISVKDMEAFDVSKIMLVVMGAMFIFMGNFMPKIEKNRTLGVKTKWSMYNEVTWQKTHRFAGFMSVIIGVIILISGLFFKEMVNFIILMSLIVIFVVSTTIASYRYYKNEKSIEQTLIDQK